MNFKVMIIHSTDDEMISQEKSFDVFHDIYKNDPRFNFVKYDDRGHDYVYYSVKSREYKNEFNKEFDEYLNSLDEEFTAKIKESYFNDNLDKKSLFDLDLELMNKIVGFYDSHIKQFMKKKKNGEGNHGEKQLFIQIINCNDRLCYNNRQSGCFDGYFLSKKLFSLVVWHAISYRN